MNDYIKDEETLDNKIIEPEKVKLVTDYGLTGWVCPVCGAGNSPFSQRCMCVPIEYKPYC